MELTTKQIHILRHSLGLDEKGHGKEYRNYYCTGLGCDGYLEIVKLESLGFMQLGKIDGDNRFYYVTHSGKDEARKGIVYPKLTRSQKRYRDFLDADCGISFFEWLKGESARSKHMQSVY